MNQYDAPASTLTTLERAAYAADLLAWSARGCASADEPNWPDDYFNDDPYEFDHTPEEVHDDGNDS